MNTKNTILTLCLLVASTVAFAQSRTRQEKVQLKEATIQRKKVKVPKMYVPKKRLQMAYKYRSDIPKVVLNRTKQWPYKVGILHSDWIENLYGQSIDIQGNVLFPQYDYTGLEQHCDSFFVMTVNGKKGIVTKSGKKLIDFDYQTFDFTAIGENIIFATNDTSSTGEIDVYSLLGIRLCTVSELKVPFNKIAQESFCPIDVKYECNVLILSYEDKNKCTHNYAFYPDGINACEEPFEGGFIYIPVFAKDSIIHSVKNDSTGQYETKKTVAIINHDVFHPSMPEIRDEDDKGIDDKGIFESNKWTELFNGFYQERKYREALFCMEYYDLYEKQALWSNRTLPNYLVFNYEVECRELLEDYEGALSLLKGTDIEHPLPYQFSSFPTLAKINCYNYRIHQDKTKLDSLVTNINKHYVTSTQGYKEKELRRQQNAQLWGAILGGAIMGTASAIAGGKSSTTSAKPVATGTGTAYSGTSSSSSSSSSGGKQVERHDKCTVCDGKGVCKTCNGTGKRVYGGKEQRCAACDGHTKCKSCDGRGYKIRYEYVK